MREVSKQYNRFLDYVNDNYYEVISDRCTGFIINHRQSLILGPKDTTSAHDIELEELEFKNVYIEDRPGDNIAFDVVVAPLVSFSYYNKFYKKYDSDSIYTTWLRVTCTGNFGDRTLENFKIKNIEEYSQKGSDKPLDGDLVSIISNDNYDAVAEAFLLKYYPEGLNEDKPIDLNKLIANMGLKIIYKRITKDLSVFGQSYFTKVEGKFYYSEKEDYYEEEIEENTIVLDLLAHALFSFGSPSITIIHECLYFFLHKKAFKFAKIYNKNLNYSACATNGVMLNISNNDR